MTAVARRRATVSALVVVAVVLGTATGAMSGTGSGDPVGPTVGSTIGPAPTQSSTLPPSSASVPATETSLAGSIPTPEVSSDPGSRRTLGSGVRAPALWWGAAMGGIVVGAVFGWVWGSRRRPSHLDPSAVGPIDGVNGASGIRRPGSDTERLTRLARSIVAARDLVDPGSVLSRRLGEGLSEADFVEDSPVGERFDPARHHAVEVTATADDEQVDRIAEVRRVGYSDRTSGGALRPPEVVVYRVEISS